jgi:hypothetical protein
MRVHLLYENVYDVKPELTIICLNLNPLVCSDYYFDVPFATIEPLKITIRQHYNFWITGWSGRFAQV